MNVPMKRTAIAAAKEGSVLARCRALVLWPSSYYYEPKGESALNLDLMRLMDLEFTEHCFHGVIGMRDFLRLHECYWVNEKRIRRLIRIMGLEAVAPKPNLSKPCKGHKTYPYLLRGVTIDGPDHAGAPTSHTSPWARGFCTSRR